MPKAPVACFRLILEGHQCREGITVQDVYDFMTALTVKLNMRTLIPPHVIRQPLPNHIPTEDVGISGQMMFMESGCMVHHWERQRFIALDIFSCKPFKTEDAKELFTLVFDPQEVIPCIPLVGE